MHSKDNDEINKQERITCYVGVGPNKLIAKIASKFRKPDGLTVIRPEDVQDFVFPLNVSIMSFEARKLFSFW